MQRPNTAKCRSTQKPKCYLQVRPPLSFAIQQSIKDSSAWFTTRCVVTAHHVVRRPNAFEKLLIHVLGTAVVGNVSQVHINGKSRSSCGARLLRA